MKTLHLHLLLSFVVTITGFLGAVSASNSHSHHHHQALHGVLKSKRDPVNLPGGLKKPDELPPRVPGRVPGVPVDVVTLEITDNKCPAGGGYCGNNNFCCSLKGLCCPSNKCCNEPGEGCFPDKRGVQHCCSVEGEKLCASKTCIPKNTTCCKDGSYCEAGNRCIKSGCCPAGTLCEEPKFGGKTAAPDTRAIVPKIYKAPLEAA